MQFNTYDQGIGIPHTVNNGNNEACSGMQNWSVSFGYVKQVSIYFL